MKIIIAMTIIFKTKLRTIIMMKARRIFGLLKINKKNQFIIQHQEVEN